MKIAKMIFFLIKEKQTKLMSAFLWLLHVKNLQWLEDNSKDVKIGKAIHEVKSEKSKQTEISIDNIKIDKLTKDYLTEIKKSDADIEAAKW